MPYSKHFPRYSSVADAVNATITNLPLTLPLLFFLLVVEELLLNTVPERSHSLMREVASKPSISGIWQSINTRSNSFFFFSSSSWFAFRMERHSLPLAATCTWHLKDSNKRTPTFWLITLSSTSSTFVFGNRSFLIFSFLNCEVVAVLHSAIAIVDEEIFFLFSARGNLRVNQKVEPDPSLLRQPSCPPIASTSLFVIAKPSPSLEIQSYHIQWKEINLPKPVPPSVLLMEVFTWKNTCCGWFYISHPEDKLRWRIESQQR